MVTLRARKAVMGGALALGMAMVGAVPVSAQPATGYQLRIYLSGGTSPVTTFDIAAGMFACGQPKVPTPVGTVQNPTTIAWEASAGDATDCKFIDSGSGPLLALPFSVTNTYTAKIVAINSAGSSPESAPSNPFSRPGLPPSAPANVRLVRP